jgi:predicted MPP superfamily phosphohydrolase
VTVPASRPVMWRIVAIGAAWTSVWWLIIGALVAPVLPGRWTTIVLAMLAATAPLLILVRRFRGDYPSAAVRLWVFRPFWYVQLAAPLMALAGVAGAIVGAPFGAAIALGRGVLVVVGALYLLAVTAGYIGSRKLRVRTLDTHIVDLPEALEGMRIVQVSDLHVGPHSPKRYLAKVAAAVRSAQPDLIAVTGDQVDDYARDIHHFTAAFAGLTAPHGVFAVAGNHDVYAGWAGVRSGLEESGIAVLVNDAVPIVHRGERFWLVGTGDPAASGPINGHASVAPDIDRALRAVPRGAFTIALAHNPALWPALARSGVALTLSGHTHYGQLSIPRMGWSLASLFLEHAMGWHERDGSLLYINPGTNYWGLPIRIGTFHEVTVLTLRRARRGQAEISDA